MATQTIICDTDVIIDYWNRNNPRHASTKNILENLIGTDNIILSAVTVMELIVGAANKNELSKINKDLHQFNRALINDAVSDLAIELLHKYALSHGLALADALIAATSITSQIQLFTYNIKHYKFISGISLFTPVIK